MQPQLKNVLAAAISVLPFALGQTSSGCNPTNHTKPCFPTDLGLQQTFSHDFTTSGASDQFKYTASMANIKYDGEGMHMPCIKSGDGPTIQSNFYIFYGKVDITMKAAPGAGIVSAVTLLSDALDEIDLEFIGVQSTQVQTNTFRQANFNAVLPGNVSVSNPETEYHTYTIDWKTDSLTYLIDGQTARVINRAGNEDRFPQTPMQVNIGSWTAGDSHSNYWRIVWAEGPIDYSKGPFDMIVKSVKIENYSPAAQYTYKDETGSSNSIQVHAKADVSSSSSSSSASATSTGSSSSSSSSSSDSSSSTSGTKSTTTSETSTITKSTTTSASGSNSSSAVVKPTSTSSSMTTQTSNTSTATSTPTGAAAAPSSGASLKSASIVASSFGVLMAAVFVL